MSAISGETWARLAGDRVEGAALRARRVVPAASGRLLAALDSDGRRHLLVRLNGDEHGLEDRQSRGLDATTRELAMTGHSSGRYLDLACHDAGGHAAFDVIGGELAARLEKGATTTAQVVSGVLARWRRFWGQHPRQMLSREEQLGLFAEIWFLSVWMIPQVSGTTAVVRWRGPLGSRHDFEWPGRSVEVKATTSTRGRIHRINGIDQLQPPENGDLLFFSLRLREEGGASNTLPTAVAKCRALLESDAEASSQFENRLAQAGYSPAHEEDYATLRLRVVEEGLFRVGGDFPRLVPGNFSAGLPSGVERVEYEVNLGAAGSNFITASPSEMPSG